MRLLTFFFFTIAFAESHFHYSDYFQLGFMLNPSTESVLELGPGESLSQPKMQKIFQKVKFKRVENTETFFSENKDFYDLVFINAYRPNIYSPHLPTELVSYEFFLKLKQHMSDKAVLAINITDSRELALENLKNWIGLTAQQAFDKVFVFKIDANTQQYVLFATDNPRVSVETLRISAISRPQQVAKLSGPILSLAAQIGQYRPNGFNLRIVKERDAAASPLLDGLK